LLSRAQAGAARDACQQEMRKQESMAEINHVPWLKTTNSHG
jgi:hypothetical protein